MGHELQYESYLCGIHSQDIDRVVEEGEDYLRKIENEIFALILMDPSKVRNQRRKSKKDECSEDDDWLNNAQYLTKLWEELKEEWENTQSKLNRVGDAQYCIKNPVREVNVCPECHCEIEWADKEVTDENSTYPYHKPVYQCPNCGKEFASEPYEAEGENAKPLPLVVKIKTWSEG